MAALTLTPVATLLDRGIGIADVDAALTSVATYDEVNFINDGNLILVVYNANVTAGAGDRQITLKSKPDPYGRGGAAVADVELDITGAANGNYGFFPFMSGAMFNVGGTVTVTLSDAGADTSMGLWRITKRA